MYVCVCACKLYPSKRGADVSTTTLGQLCRGYLPVQHCLAGSRHPIGWRRGLLVSCVLYVSTGLDQLPAWFLRLGAPVFYKPLAHLFNLSIATATVPRQWKQASICPVPKIATPGCHADFRPISITPVLTRLMERIVVSHFLYPAFLVPPPHMNFRDRYAFRPTGSTTAALISLLQTVTDLLLNNPFVAVIALYVSKAFDTVTLYMYQVAYSIKKPDFYRVFLKTK